MEITITDFKSTIVDSCHYSVSDGNNYGKLSMLRRDGGEYYWESVLVEDFNKLIEYPGPLEDVIMLNIIPNYTIKVKTRSQNAKPL